MMIALLVISGIEITVTHLLVAHWSRTAAMVMFVISDVSLLYLIGLIKSLRLSPVLLLPGACGCGPDSWSTGPFPMRRSRR